MIYAIVSIFSVVIVAQGILHYLHDKKLTEMYEHNGDSLLVHLSQEKKEWHIERQQLLDRIQAPSYDVMKHHEVKIIKAKNNEKEPEKLEVM